MDKVNRFLGAMFGLAYGDATSFPALFHRFQTMPRRRHNFLWRSNSELDAMGINRLMMPFTHRLNGADLELYPTDDTEFAMLTLKVLVESDGVPDQETFFSVWRDQVLPVADEFRAGFSERAAVENLKYGLTPPATGNDNPLHYEDSAVPRAVPIGLWASGNPETAAQLALLDAQITQAEDGIYAAQAMAVAIAILADGGAVDDALAQARKQFPESSWIAHIDGIAQACVAESDTPQDVILLLDQRVINTVYSYGCAAPETLPAAFAIMQVCDGDFHLATGLSHMLAKSADSVPAMVGALAGCYKGIEAISPKWREALSTAHGVCLPFLKDARLDDLTRKLYEKTQA